MTPVKPPVPTSFEPASMDPRSDRTIVVELSTREALGRLTTLNLLAFLNGLRRPATSPRHTPGDLQIIARVIEEMLEERYQVRPA